MPLLCVDNLHVRYASGGKILRTVDGVSLRIEKGETVGLVGESGCGKTTLGRSLLRLVPSSEGEIRVDDVDISRFNAKAMRPYRKRLQMVFQDPGGSLNPRQTILTLLDTALKANGFPSRGERRELARAIIVRVGLAESALDRRPHEFSGGQRQRIAIARALVLRPELIVCDEPVSALDVSIQAQILNLLLRVKRELNLSYLFISHDLSVVRYFCDRVMVMYLGRVVESADVHVLWREPCHPYTRALIEAVPSTDLARRRLGTSIKGDLQSVAEQPQGCRFLSRCPQAAERCAWESPALRPVAENQYVACHFA